MKKTYPSKKLCIDCALLGAAPTSQGRSILWCKRRHRAVAEQKLLQPCRFFVPKGWE